MTRPKFNEYIGHILAVFSVLAMIAFIILYNVNSHTRDIIADNKLQATRKVFNDIIPGNYTNDIFNDSIEVTESAYLGTKQAVTIYRIRNNGNSLGVLFHPVIANGYKSEIELGIGISNLGIITGVRVISENETEGLGDQISQHKTNWILMFTGKSYENLPRERWSVKNENGDFDQISGATITSRSVINAVRNTLDFHNISGDNIYKQ